MKTSKPANAADGRSRILVAALHVFATSGFEGSSLRQIARHAGEMHQLVVYHFKTKDELIAAMAPGSTWIDCSTAAPAVAGPIASAGADRRVHVVDAPRANVVAKHDAAVAPGNVCATANDPTSVVPVFDTGMSISLLVGCPSAVPEIKT